MSRLSASFVTLTHSISPRSRHILYQSASPIICRDGVHINVPPQTRSTATQIPPRRTSARASARALLMRARWASLRAAAIGATVAASDDAADRIRLPGRLDRRSPSSCHQAENSEKSTSPLPSLAEGLGNDSVRFFGLVWFAGGRLVCDVRFRCGWCFAT